MDRRRKVGVGTALVVLVVALGIVQTAFDRTAQAQKPGVPRFEWDPTWPKLPENTVLGTISGLYVDAQDRIWVTQRPATLEPGERDFLQNTECCHPLPPVSVFDAAGNFVRGIGPVAYVAPANVGRGGAGANLAGKSQPSDRPKDYDWPFYEHGVHVDYKGNLWLSGNGEGDNQIVKLTNDGKFILQIGKPKQSKGNSDTANLNQPAKVWVSPRTNEAFVADGYVNRRVIVYDADTGAFKRMWGAYGNKPTDPAEPGTRNNRPREDKGEGRGPEQFNLVHAVSLSKDDMVYVADRVNNRVQVFTLDGKYVNEVFNNRKTIGNGAVFDVDFSGDANETYLYVADNTNGHVQIYDRKTLTKLGQFSRFGHQGGQLNRIHSLAADSRGNVYTGETGGRRIQKFVFKGVQ